MFFEKPQRTNFNTSFPVPLMSNSSSFSFFNVSSSQLMFNSSTSNVTSFEGNVVETHQYAFGILLATLYSIIGK
jgi:hypothetical protein